MLGAASRGTGVGGGNAAEGVAAVQKGGRSALDTTAIQTYRPPNDGFLLNPRTETLNAGYQFSRYGGYFDEAGSFKDFGNYAAPVNVPFGMRSLPLESENRPLTIYEVVKPMPDVKSGPAAPAFNQFGLGE